ncbi:hypothetical protein Leryth_011596, partial [Lithospermum erythrorhizon]
MDGSREFRPGTTPSKAELKLRTTREEILSQVFMVPRTLDSSHSVHTTQREARCLLRFRWADLQRKNIAFGGCRK